MTIDATIDDLITTFDTMPSWEDRYAQLISMGKRLAPYPEDHRSERYQVKGCQSQVWLYPSFDGNTVHFEADSDALIVKGLIALLMSIYNDRTPQEIVATRTDFIQRIGLEQHLSQNRANGLVAMLKQIKLYALAFSAMQKGRPA